LLSCGRTIEPPHPRCALLAGSRSPVFPLESTRSTAHLGRIETNGTAGKMRFSYGHMMPYFSNFREFDTVTDTCSQALQKN